MLSRVADRLYWLARYLERAESVARLTASYSQFVLDAPSGSELGWDVLIKIIDAEPAFHKRYKNSTERNVNKFMLDDVVNGGSIRTSLQKARENIRTSRDVLPGELWEMVNELYWYVDDNAKAAAQRQSRFKFLDEVIARNLQINGVLATSLARDDAFRFLKFGQLMERSDMTSRVVDIGAAAIIGKRTTHAAAYPQLWNNLLKSLSATSAYQRAVGPIVEANEVINFVFKDESFPRSLHFCMRSIADTLCVLKKSAPVLAPVQSISQTLSSFDASTIEMHDLHSIIDDIQRGIINTHNAAFNAWFATA